jgi:hypothetical protein
VKFLFFLECTQKKKTIFLYNGNDVQACLEEKKAVSTILFAKRASVSLPLRVRKNKFISLSIGDRSIYKAEAQL